MTSTDLLPAAVLRRKAVVYVRQSTQTQVQTNLESQRRQLRARIRIAVWQIQRRHQYAADGGLDVASLRICRVARQRAANWNGLSAAREQRHAIPCSLTHHKAAVACALEFRFGVSLCGGLELLERHRVLFCRIQPGQQQRQALVDVVDVPGRNLHGPRIATSGHRPSSLLHPEPQRDATSASNRVRMEILRGDHRRVAFDSYAA